MSALHPRKRALPDAWPVPAGHAAFAFRFGSGGPPHKGSPASFVTCLPNLPGPAAMAIRRAFLRGPVAYMPMWRGTFARHRPAMLASATIETRDEVAGSKGHLVLRAPFAPVGIGGGAVLRVDMQRVPRSVLGRWRTLALSDLPHPDDPWPPIDL